MADCAFCDGYGWVDAVRPPNLPPLYDTPLTRCKACHPDWKHPSQRAEVLTPKQVENRVKADETERWYDK